MSRGVEAGRNVFRTQALRLEHSLAATKVKFWKYQQDNRVWRSTWLYTLMSRTWGGGIFSHVGFGGEPGMIRHGKVEQIMTPHLVYGAFQYE